MKPVGLLIMGLALAGCARMTPTPGLPIQVTVVQGGQTPAPGATGQAGDTTPGSLLVRIDSPEDNSTVITPQIEVKGYTTPGAVITIDEVIVIADASGAFVATVPLVEGPNVLEVLANDAQGNQGYIQVTVTYDPQG